MKEACGGDAFPGDPGWAPNDRGLMTGTRPGVSPSEFQPLPGAPGKPNSHTTTETQSHRPPPSCPPQDTARVPQGTPGLPGPVAHTPVHRTWRQRGLRQLWGKDKESPVAPPTPATPLAQENHPRCWQQRGTDVPPASVHRSHLFAKAGVRERVLQRPWSTEAQVPVGTPRGHH